MDILFAQAISKIANEPLGVQRQIGVALLAGDVAPDLPVIEFTAD